MFNFKPMIVFEHLFEHVFFICCKQWKLGESVRGWNNASSLINCGLPFSIQLQISRDAFNVDLATPPLAIANWCRQWRDLGCWSTSRFLAIIITINIIIEFHIYNVHWLKICSTIDNICTCIIIYDSTYMIKQKVGVVKNFAGTSHVISSLVLHCLHVQFVSVVRLVSQSQTSHEKVWLQLKVHVAKPGKSSGCC